MAQPSSDQQVQALVAAQARIRGQYTTQATAVAAQSAQGFSGWYDTAAITAWAALVANRIEALQRALAQTTDAYLARVFSILTGHRVRPIGRVDVASLRQGVTHAGSYGRAADVYRWQQSQFDRIATSLLTGPPGLPDVVDPIQAAIDRVSAVADMDMQLADRAQSTAVLTEHADRLDVRGYRRVIHPELSKGGTCGLCIAASDRVYHVKELRALHARCECTVLPIVGQQDPGSSLNNLDLKHLYAQAGSTGAADLKRTRFQVDVHGELGPVLSPHGAKVRTPQDVQRDLNRPPRTAKSDAEVAAQITRIREQLTTALPKAQDLAQAEPKTWGDYLTKLEARISDLDQQLAA